MDTGTCIGHRHRIVTGHRTQDTGHRTQDTFIRAHYDVSLFILVYGVVVATSVFHHGDWGSNPRPWQ